MATTAINNESTPSIIDLPVVLFTAIGCFILGLCMLMNSQVRSDGTWPLYADRLLHGAKIYSDLHTPLQPFFYLEVAGWQRVVGRSWLASLILPVIHLLLFVSGYCFLALQSTRPKLEKAVYLAASFMVAIGFEFYKFEDFHVVSDVQYVFSSLILLRLEHTKGGIVFKSLVSVFIGVMAAISFTTRANEGFFLYLADSMALFVIAKDMRWRAILNLTFGFFVTWILVILLTDDTLRAYFSSSLVGSQTIKGGTLQLAVDPIYLTLQLVIMIFILLAQPRITLGLPLIALAIALLFFALPAARNRGRLSCPLILVVLAVTAIDVSVIIREIISDPHFVLISMSSVLALIMIWLAVRAALSIIRAIPHTQSRASIVLLPAAMLAAQSMSSGGNFSGSYSPIGLFIALAPTLYPATFERRWIRISAISGCIALAASGAMAKITLPVRWQYYQSQPMFVGRRWIKHPIYGPMYVDAKDYTFFESVCARLGGYQANVSLLSMPYSFGNYYCGIDPWDGYVQTWLDTTSQDTILALISQLKDRPPAWILYERQLKILRLHERLYFHGGRIAQRSLDEFIMAQISRGDWKVELADEPRPDDRWMLIRTSAPAPSSGPRRRLQ